MKNDRCFVHWYIKSFARGFNDANICLVGDDKVNLVGGQTCCLNRFFSRVDHDAHSTTKNFFTFHMQSATNLGVQQFFERAVCVKVPTKQLTWTGGSFDYCCARTVGKQDRRVAVCPVGDSRKCVGANNQNASHAHCDEAMTSD